MAIIGGGNPPAPTPGHYRSPAEELHENVLEAVSNAPFLTRMALVNALERGTGWASLPADVRALFETVADGMGLGT